MEEVSRPRAVRRLSCCRRRSPSFPTGLLFAAVVVVCSSYPPPPPIGRCWCRLFAKLLLLLLLSPLLQSPSSYCRSRTHREVSKVLPDFSISSTRLPQTTRRLSRSKTTEPVTRAVLSGRLSQPGQLAPHHCVPQLQIKGAPGSRLGINY